MGRAIAHLVSAVEYKAQTKHVFPLAETVLVAKLLLQGHTRAEIRQKVLEEDLFELRSPASRAGALQIIFRRLDKVPREYVELLANGNSDTRRATLLFLILREHRLLKELIAEVLIEKLRAFTPVLTAMDLKTFFYAKRDQESALFEWSDSTFQKAASNTLLVLVKASLLQPLQPKGKYEIRAVPTPAALRQQLMADGYEQYLTLMLN